MSGRPRKSRLICRCDTCVSNVNSNGTRGVYRRKAEHKEHLRELKAAQQTWRTRNAEPEIVYEPSDSDSDFDDQVSDMEVDTAVTVDPLPTQSGRPLTFDTGWCFS